MASRAALAPAAESLTACPMLVYLWSPVNVFVPSNPKSQAAPSSIMS